jgi:hypothetical protein
VSDRRGLQWRESLVGDGQRSLFVNDLSVRPVDAGGDPAAGCEHGRSDQEPEMEALIIRLRIVTRRVSEEERRFLADASGYDDPLLEFCATL